MPDARCGEALAGLQVKVEAWNARRFLCAFMKKVDADVGLVWRLVTRETRVTIDAKHRPAGRPGIGDEARCNFREPRSEVADETQSWIADLAFVALLFRGKPI